ncbi:MAG TPA: glutamate ABC transporter substrate-binding protein [Actinomycetota bacterium]|nr:glutamate ABC transporter substrate-binding protein [Actinomycetota bacterium]
MYELRRRRWLLAALAAVAMLGAACGGGETTPTDTGGGEEDAMEKFPAGSTMAKLQERGTITVGVKYDVPLFGFKNPQSGEVEGFDVDLAQRVADELGVELELKEAISDNRIPFLQDGTVDLVFSTMTITTDRDADIDFSRPYYIAHGRILTAGDSGIEDVKDLTADTTVCTALDSTYETTVLPKQAPDAEVKTPDTYSECFAQLQRGSVDALVTDDVILAGFLQQDESMAIVGPDLTTDPYGAGIKEGDTEFADFVSGVLDETLEDGTWQELFDKWLGQYTGQEAEDPAPWTLEQALETYPCVETC